MHQWSWFSRLKLQPAAYLITCAQKMLMSATYLYFVTKTLVFLITSSSSRSYSPPLDNKRRCKRCWNSDIHTRVTLKLMKKLKFILFEVVPSEVVTPTKYMYINSVKFQNFMLMFTGGSTWLKFLLCRSVWRQQSVSGNCRAEWIVKFIQGFNISLQLVKKRNNIFCFLSQTTEQSRPTQKPEICCLLGIIFCSINFIKTAEDTDN